MLVRVFVPWIVLAAILGFALGGSFVATFHIPINPSDIGVSHPPAQQGGEKKHPHPFSGEWFTTDPVAFGTFSLVFVTATLALVTGGLFFYTRLLAQDAARTAKSEFLASHRPRIRVRQFKIISVNDDLAFVRFSAVNVGDTVAKGLTCRASPQYFDRSATLPPYIDVPFKLVATPEDLPRGHSREIEIKVIKPMLGLAERLAAGLALHVYGVLEYANEDSSSHWTTGFCRQEQITDERFTAVDDPDYEYED